MKQFMQIGETGIFNGRRYRCVSFVSLDGRAVPCRHCAFNRLKPNANKDMCIFLHCLGQYDFNRTNVIFVTDDPKTKRRYRSKGLYRSPNKLMATEKSEGGDNER